jgi:hypothetical protein
MAINILVIFESRTGATEKLALAAAVGAVQARANIRMRRLPDSGKSQDSNEELGRMRKEYVAPARADAVWADAVIIGSGGKIAGEAVNAAGATAYGRRIAMEVGTQRH